MHSTIAHTSDVVYRAWRGEAVRFVRQCRRASKGASRGRWLIIPEERLRVHETELQRAGYNCLGQLLSVDHLDAKQRNSLASYLDLTRKQGEEYAEAGALSEDYLEREAALLETCPRWTVTGYELDLTDDLKGTLAGRQALLAAGGKIRDYYRRLGVSLRWSWSASCPHGQGCPHQGGPCLDGVSGLHGEPGIATQAGAHPSLLNLFGREAREVCAVVGVAIGGDRERAAFLDVSTLRAGSGTRGSVFRPLWGAHPSRGPKVPCRELGFDEGATQLDRSWMGKAYQEQDEQEALELVQRRALEKLPPRKPRQPPLDGSVDRGIAALPSVVQLLNEVRPDDPRTRQKWTLALATVFLEAGLSRPTTTDVLQAGFRRSDRRTVEHAVDTTAEALSRAKHNRGTRKPMGKGRLIKDGHYAMLVRFSAALARDTKASLFSVYLQSARLWQAAGHTIEQKQAEQLLAKLGTTHRYGKALKNSLACGITLAKNCDSHGPQELRTMSCKAPWDPFCKSLQYARQAAQAAEMWGANKDDKIYALTSIESPTLQDAQRRRGPGEGPEARSRWFVGCRGEGRWYSLILFHGRWGKDAASVAVRRCGPYGVVEQVSAGRAADMALEALLSVHAVCRDLFMQEDPTRWLSFMDQIHHRKMTHGLPECLPWPRKHERLEAGEDFGEHPDDCGAECAEHKLVSFTAMDPVSGREIGRWRGYPPSVGAIVKRLEGAALLLPSRRLATVTRAQRSLARAGPT